MTSLVFSCSHVDEALRNEPEKHLSPLEANEKDYYMARSPHCSLARV